MQLKICRGCKKEYDLNKYGTGKAYCSTVCRLTRGGTREIITGHVGRKPRFPKSSEGEVVLAKSDMQDFGFELHPINYTRSRFPNRCFIVSRDGLSIRAVFGGANHKAERWAEVVIRRPFKDTLTVESTCHAGAYIDNSSGKPVKRSTHCGLYTCTKCIKAKILKLKIRFTIPASKSKTGAHVVFREI